MWTDLQNQCLEFAKNILKVCEWSMLVQVCDGEDVIEIKTVSIFKIQSYWSKDSKLNHWS